MTVRTWLCEASTRCVLCEEIEKGSAFPAILENIPVKTELLILEHLLLKACFFGLAYVPRSNAPPGMNGEWIAVHRSREARFTVFNIAPEFSLSALVYASAVNWNPQKGRKVQMQSSVRSS